FEEIVKPWIITRRLPAVVNQEKFHITIVRLAAFFQQFKDFIGFAEARAKPGHVVIMIRRRVLNASCRAFARGLNYSGSCNTLRISLNLRSPRKLSHSGSVLRVPPRKSWCSR